MFRARCNAKVGEGKIVNEPDRVRSLSAEGQGTPIPATEPVYRSSQPERQRKFASGETKVTRDSRFESWQLRKTKFTTEAQRTRRRTGRQSGRGIEVLGRLRAKPARMGHLGIWM